MEKIKIKNEVIEFFFKHNIYIKNSSLGLDIKYHNRPKYAYITDNCNKLCITTVASYWSVIEGLEFINELVQAVSLLNIIKEIQPEIIL